jgi:arabinose-5-phosphate isomerase
MKLADCMTRTPQTIGPDVLASEALTLMEKRRITCVIVVDGARTVLGVVHLHDLWGMQLV